MHIVHPLEHEFLHFVSFSLSCCSPVLFVCGIKIHLGLTRKGRMASNTIELPKVNSLSLHTHTPLCLSHIHHSLSHTHTESRCVLVSNLIIIWCFFKGLSIICEASEPSAIRCRNFSALKLISEPERHCGYFSEVDPCACARGMVYTLS